MLEFYIYGAVLQSNAMANAFVCSMMPEQEIVPTQAPNILGLSFACLLI